MNKKINECHLPFKRETPTDGHYFFGYFDKNPWDTDDGRLLAHRISFVARQPLFGEKATVGLVKEGSFTELAETAAWNWQQGAMLQWFSGDEVIYNDVERDRHIARILDIKTGETRSVCRPVYCLSPDRRHALSVNFSRLDRERPGYGYPGLDDPTLEYGFPDFDGIYLVDLKNNTSKLLISLEQIVRAFPETGMDATVNWFNHLLFSPDGRYFAFIHRWRIFRQGIRSYHTRMFTANIEGSEIRPLPMDHHASHYTWLDENRLIIFSRTLQDGAQYHIYRCDGGGKIETIARDLLPNDGHCSFSPDGQWMLTDSYPGQEKQRKIFLYHPGNDTAWEVGSFFSETDWPHPTRCDLHPRWSTDMKQICFDSMHEGIRGIYTMNIEEIINR